MVRNLKCLGVGIVMLLVGASSAMAYNRQYAVAYSTTWWNTDSNLAHYADRDFKKITVANHIYGSLAQPKPGPYTWYYAFGFQIPFTNKTIHYWRSQDDGTGNRLMADGEDCTNFVSQALLAGGLQFAGPTTGQGGTLKEVRRLDAALRRSNAVVTVAQTAGDLPSMLQLGDVIEFGGRHMTVVVGTSPTLLVAYHSYDNIGVTPAAIMGSSPLMRPAVAFHITQDLLTIPQNQTPPNISIFDMTGSLLGAAKINPDSSPSEGTIPAISRTPNTAVVSDGVGIQSFIVTKDAPLIDGIEDVQNGVGSEVFRDDAFYPSGHTYIFPSLTDGVYFVEAFDVDGNASVSGFTIDKTPPFIKKVLVGDMLVVDNSQPIPNVFVSPARPRISVTFDDAASKIDQATVKLYLDGVDAPWTFGSIGSLTVFHDPPAVLADGTHLLRMVAKDLAANEVDTSVSFQIATTPPTLALINADGEEFTQRFVSKNAIVTSFAIHHPAPAYSLEFFDGNVPNGPPVYASPGNLDLIDRNREFSANSWHYVRACDVALNCIYHLFGVSESAATLGNPPNPPPPCPGCTQRPNHKPGTTPPPPDDPNNPPGPPLPDPPEPPAPICRGAACLNQPPAPEPPWAPKPRPPKYCDTPRNCLIPVAFPHDPNAMYGPAGPVTPGQMMTYTIEFENEGQGMALETFVRDTLDPALDATTLVLRDMNRVNFLTGAQSPANFPWSYDARTRTITVMTGDADSRQGGRFILEARLRADTAPGTMITNQAVVHFPNSLEVTPTNVIVSAVPLPTQVAYEGASSTTFLAPTRFAARLTAAGRPLTQQPVEFLLGGTSWTVTTDATGLAALSIAVSVLPGTYNLQARYLGDGLLHTARETPTNFVVAKKPVRLQTPFAEARSTETARIAVSLTDDEGRLLSAQAEDPKTIHLELLQDGGVVMPLGSALLSGASVALEIALPRPLRLSWSVRARFDGDLRYAAAISTGVLQLIDQTPPTISIGSPAGGRTYSGSQAIPIGFSVQDGDDSAPLIAAMLVSSGSQSLRVSDSDAIVASSLSPGQWSLVVQATDWAGNHAELHGAAFQVLAVSDVLAPRTSLSVGRPQAGTAPVFVTTATAIDLTAVDDMTAVGDGIGLGVAKTYFAIDSSSFAAYTGTFRLVALGTHTIQYYSVDVLGNAEAARNAQVAVDGLPARTTVAFAEPKFAGERLFLSSATLIHFASADDLAVVGDGRGVGTAQTLLAVDSTAFATVASTASLPTEGPHLLAWFSRDLLDNAEIVASTSVAVDLTPPVTRLSISTPMVSQVAGTVVGPATMLSLIAQDPVSGGVASGLKDTFLAVSTSVFALAPATFTLSGADGARVVSYYSRDNVINAERIVSTTVLLDATPPLTNLLVAGGRQFAGPDAITFYASSDTRLILVSTDPTVNGVASGLAFTQWRDNGGPFTAYVSSLTLTEGAHALGYQGADNVANMEVLRSTNAWVDATPPATSVSVGLPTFTAADGTIYVSTATPISFAAVDPILPTGQTGSGLARIETSLDGAPFAAYVAPLTLTEGRHVILYRAVDNVGNVEAAHSIALQSDATPPVSALVIGAPQFQLPGFLLVSTRTPFSITVVDPVTNSVASGVKDTYFRVSDIAPSPAVFSAFTAPLAMAGADVNKVVEFFSRDNVLNTEAVKSSTVLLDSTPPEVALLSPASCGAGICRVLKGKFPVLGTARDAHFAGYQLEVAPGQDASSGFTLVSSSTLAVNSSTRGTWDTTALSGWLTVRLTATDLVANTAFVAINMFVGDPGELLTLGNHEVFNMPAGVAVGGDGKIYVADRDNNRVAVFSSTGALLASFGGSGHDDDHRLSTGTLRLAEPSGVAVDADGNIYVADTDNDRVLKLSAAGQILLSVGGREHEQEGAHDDRTKERGHRLPGRFHDPAGVAVDAARNIYVADTDNRRVQVFSSTGAFSFQFDMPVALARPDDDDHDDAAALGKPFGIALDAAGNIYVADPKGGRALKFGATGQLLMTMPIPGDKPGTFGQPFGIAVSTGGDCVLVSDRKYSRILKFDFLGSQNLSFGTKGKIHDDDAPAPSGTIVFKKPMGLALDADGGLFVADRNNDRIRKFSLPTGRAPLVVPPPKPGDDRIARDVVDKEDGGTVARKDHAGVDIPSGAVAQDIKVTVSVPAAGVADESSRKHAVDDKQLKAASPPVEYGPEGTKFAAPVTLTLPYTPELLSLGGVDEKDLKVHYWNRDKAQWEDLDSEVDAKARTVKAKTTHFSLYQVFSGTVSAAATAPLAAADATFTFHDAYAFPSPVRGSGPITIRIQTGLADSVEVHVYDLAGRKIHSSSNFTLNPSFDDGNGKGVQYTYDQNWDVSGVGSGVYTYVITAKKAGQTDIHKTGKVGVIR